MAGVVPGRFTAELPGGFVVFMIGMRINRFWAFHKWVPVAKAMGPMLRELYMNKELGFLDAEYHFTLRGPVIVSYWRSFEQLEHYARHGAKHLQAWRDFNQKIGTDGTVGIFHETYLIGDGQYECVYNNMPVMGLAKAGKHVPASGKRETASRRLGRDNDPAVPTPRNPS